MMEAVDFVHAEGWEAPPTLFALVPTELVVDQIELDDDSAPLTLVVQDNLPENILPGPEELAEYASRIASPRQVEGAVVAQEMMFKDTAAPDAEPRPARLSAGCLRDEGLELTVMQTRHTGADP